MPLIQQYINWDLVRNTDAMLSILSGERDFQTEKQRLVQYLEGLQGQRTEKLPLRHHLAIQKSRILRKIPENLGKLQSDCKCYWRIMIYPSPFILPSLPQRLLIVRISLGTTQETEFQENQIKFSPLPCLCCNRSHHVPAKITTNINLYIGLLICFLLSSLLFPFLYYNFRNIYGKIRKNYHINDKPLRAATSVLCRLSDST